MSNICARRLSNRLVSFCPSNYFRQLAQVSCLLGKMCLFLPQVPPLRSCLVPWGRHREWKPPSSPPLRHWAPPAPRSRCWSTIAYTKRRGNIIGLMMMVIMMVLKHTRETLQLMNMWYTHRSIQTAKKRQRQNLHSRDLYLRCRHLCRQCVNTNTNHM